jgi:hypothetical protein
LPFSKGRPAMIALGRGGLCNRGQAAYSKQVRRENSLMSNKSCLHRQRDGVTKCSSKLTCAVHLTWPKKPHSFLIADNKQPIRVGFYWCRGGTCTVVAEVNAGLGLQQVGSVSMTSTLRHELPRDNMKVWDHCENVSPIPVHQA